MFRKPLKLELAMKLDVVAREHRILTTSMDIWVDDPIATAKERSCHHKRKETHHLKLSKFLFSQMKVKNSSFDSLSDK